MTPRTFCGPKPHGRILPRVSAQSLSDIVLNDEWSRGVLRAAREAGLPKWCIAGGFCRNLVWDRLHQADTPNRPRDIDVAYFDPGRQLEVKAATAALNQQDPDLLWEPANVALPREEGAQSPDSLATALATFPETVTSIGVRLEPDDSLTVIAPFGLNDLFDMICRRNPASQTVEQFHRRVEAKRIRDLWPQAVIIEG